MPPSVLIAFATRSGSTAEVAQSIGLSLDEAGFVAQVLPVQQVDSIGGRAAIVLGTPLYFGRFPSNFRKFLVRHKHTLDCASPWCFVLGPVRAEPADFEAARDQAARQFERYPWVHPADVHVFGGKWDLNTLPFPFSLARHLPLDQPPSDVRNWSEIRAWADRIAEQIKTAA